MSSRIYQKRCFLVEERSLSRITISLDSEIVKKISELLEEMEKKTSRSWSMSKTINILILSGMLSQKKLQIGDWAILRDFAKGKRLDLADVNLEEFLISLELLDKIP